MKSMMKMIRCMTCGKLLGDKYEEFERRVARGEDAERVLDEMGMTRYCCRRMLLTSVDLTDEILRFKEKRPK